MSSEDEDERRLHQDECLVGALIYLSIVDFEQVTACWLDKA